MEGGGKSSATSRRLGRSFLSGTESGPFGPCILVHGKGSARFERPGERGDLRRAEEGVGRNHLWDRKKRNRKEGEGFVTTERNLRIGRGESRDERGGKRKFPTQRKKKALTRGRVRGHGHCI